MAKGRNETEISNDGVTRVAELEVGQPDGTKTTTRYAVPSTPERFREFVMELSDKPAEPGAESPLALAHRQYCASVANMARQAVYEAVQAESCYITVNGKRMLLLDIPLANLIPAINGSRDVNKTKILMGDDDPKGFAPWQNTAKRLVADGKAREDEVTGKLVAVDGKARENEETGKLEAV